MNYDTINLLGLQPDDILFINVTKDIDTIFIDVTLSIKNVSCPICNSSHINIKDYKFKLKIIPLLKLHIGYLLQLLCRFSKTVKD